MHHAMPAKAVGKEEAGNIRRLAEDRVMVRGHFIEPSPSPLGIDRDIFEYRHSIRGADQNFLDKARVEISFVAGRFFRIVQASRNPRLSGRK